MGTQLSLKRGTSPQFSARVYCGQTAGWIKVPLGMEVGLGPDDIVLDGDSVPHPQKGGRAPSPIFGKFLLCPNGWMHHDATWYGCRPRPRGLCVQWGPSSVPQKNWTELPPQFSAHFCCGQMAGCIKMPPGTEVGLSPREFVLDGHPAPSPKEAELPSFWRTSIVAKRLHGSRCHLVRR